MDFDFDFGRILEFVLKIVIPILAVVAGFKKDKKNKNAKKVKQRKVKPREQEIKAIKKEGKKKYIDDKSKIKEKNTQTEKKKIFEDMQKNPKNFIKKENFVGENKVNGYQLQKKIENVSNYCHEVENENSKEETFDLRDAIIYSEILQKPLVLRGNR